MHIKQYFYFLGLFLIILQWTACSSSKFLQKGYVVNKDYMETIPFELRQGIIIVKGKIKGKTYEFIFDSGGINLIAKDIAAELGLKGDFSSKTNDSQGNSTQIDYFTLDKVQLGVIDFAETAFGIVDFSQLNDVSCLELKGMIGANLMRHAIWEIDYQQQVIKFSNRQQNFDIPTSAINIPFTMDNLGSPNIEMTLLGKVEKKVELDLGATGSIKLRQELLTHLQQKQPNTKVITGQGQLSAGLFGYGAAETSSFAKVAEIASNQFQLKNKVVTFKDTDQSSLGNEIFKNYRFILDWLQQEAIFIPVEFPSDATLKNYGFDPIYKDGQPYVGFIFKEYNFGGNRPEITDQIIQINDWDCRNISKDDWCVIGADLKDYKYQKIRLTVLRAGKRLTFDLPLQNLL